MLCSFFLFFSSFIFIFKINVLGKVYNYGWSLRPSSWTWGSSPKLNGFGKLGNEVVKSNLVTNSGCVNINGSHCSTVERLYAWEKKLFEEVKVRSFGSHKLVCYDIILLWGLTFLVFLPIGAQE